MNQMQNFIVSGYSFDDPNSHAQMQKKIGYIFRCKVKRILLHLIPKRYKEEAIESKKIVDGKKIILVTTASHMKKSINVI